MMTGGGSGGHITPLLAVAHKLKERQPECKIIYIGQIGDHFNEVPAASPYIDTVHLVRAGKFRRYHGEGLKQLLDFKTIALNIRDAFWVLIGIWQSFWLLRRLKPNAIFIKGGFVGVPVGLAAAAQRIPYLTHDSDALPGLANRIVAPWAKMHAVAMPEEVYTQYPRHNTVTVGIPLSSEYHPLSQDEVASARSRLGVPADALSVLVTGGGLGAHRINTAMLSCSKELLDRYPHLHIAVLAGRANEDTVRKDYKTALPKEQSERVKVLGFVTNLHDYSAAADVIVTRAGATSLAEFAAQQKACVVVPNPFLTGGHQLKNAKVLAESRSVKIVEESVLAQDDHALMPALVELLDSKSARLSLGKQFGKLAIFDAADKITTLIVEIANVSKAKKTTN